MQLSSLDLNLLVVLDALLQTRSVKRAAARVALSPSATSHALARLRELLDDPLLVRAGRSMVLTPRAERLRDELTRALAELERLLAPEEAVDPAKLTRGFRIAATDYAESEVIVPLARALSSSAPLVDIHALPQEPDTVAQLRAGDCDAAVGVFPGTPDDIHKLTLYRDHFAVLLRRGHPAARGRLTVERYAALDHVLVSPRGRPGGVVDTLLRERGLERRVARSVPSFHVAPQLVAHSDYALTVSARIAKRHADVLDLVIRKPPLELPRFLVCVAWHSRHDRDPAHTWLREQIVALVGAGRSRG